MPVFDFSDRHIKFFESRVQFLLTTALFTYSHREGVNSNPVSKNILLFVKTSSLIPTERNQMHTLNLKKFYPFTYLELGSRNAPCFHKKFEKYFVRLWDGLFYLPKKSFHLFGI